jgi:hypothetical protein
MPLDRVDEKMHGSMNGLAIGLESIACVMSGDSTVAHEKIQADTLARTSDVRELRERLNRDRQGAAKPTIARGPVFP